jgi:Berberine and berberine like
MPGRHVYQTGTGINTIRPEVFKAGWAAYVQALGELHAADPSFAPIIITELTDTSKIVEVPRGTMAFNSRGPQRNLVVAIFWSPEEGEKPAQGNRHAALAKQLATQLREVFYEKISVEENNAYGNYGALS